MLEPCIVSPCIQHLVDRYLRDVTGDLTGSSTSGFPYNLPAKNDQTIFSPECVPDGLCLSDPDHLPSVQINRLNAHWLKQQDQGLAPLVILNASPLHGVSIKRSEKGKAKAKVDWVDITSDEEEEKEEEEEEELQNEQNEQGHEEEENNDDQENEDDSKKNNDRNKGQPVVIKYGPLQGKQKKILHLLNKPQIPQPQGLLPSHP
jgi:hypothetical protein